ncbi:hypothetical protein [Bradyrhizobium lablabi]|uniref:hypothetical protein n=1 Tax=Bradyrhizobium lablabi TaxID=722472 RepID=UPI0020115CAD|nr:hypothetical protein [Bradyrhizobium lablabi]
MSFHCQRHPERCGRAIKEAISEIDRDVLPRQLSAILKARNAVDVMCIEGRSKLYAKILDRDELQFELLADGAIAAAILGEAPGGLGLEFTLAEIADIGANHEAENVLGIDLFRLHGERQQRSENCDRCTRRRSSTNHFDDANHDPQLAQLQTAA